MNIAEIRQKYPQYKDLSDDQLAKGLHSKFYSDMDFGEFSKKIGLQAETKIPIKVTRESDLTKDILPPEAMTNVLPFKLPIPSAKDTTAPIFNELGLPVGEPGVLGKALEVPFLPGRMIARSPGAVTEANILDEGVLEKKEASISDLGGKIGRSLLQQGAASEAMPFNITKKEDIGDLGEQIGRLVFEAGVEMPVASGLIRVLSGSIGSAAKLIRESTTWRRMTIPDRLPVVQSLNEMATKMKAGGFTEAQILRTIKKTAGEEAAFERFAQQQGIKLQPEIKEAKVAKTIRSDEGLVPETRGIKPEGSKEKGGKDIQLDTEIKRAEVKQQAPQKIVKPIKVSNKYAGNVFKHFTSKEGKEALEQGKAFDYSKKPIHGTGGLDDSEKVGRFAGNRIYLSLDDKIWGKITERIGEDKVVPAETLGKDSDTLKKSGANFFYDYDKQKWMAKVGAKKITKNLESVDYTLSKDAKVKIIDSVESLKQTIKEADSQYWDTPKFWDSLSKKYDAVVLLDVGKNYEKTQNKFFRAALSDQIIVLNQDKVKINVDKKPTPPTEKPKGKEPWEMTKDEFNENYIIPYDVTGFPNIKGKTPNEIITTGIGIKNASEFKKRISGFREDEINQAIRENKPVPESVLKDYPELKKETGLGKVEGVVKSKVKFPPNAVLRDIRDYEGNRIGGIAEPYDGTREDAKRAAEIVTKRMYAEFPDASNIQSRMGATDAHGRGKWAISPNLEHINQVDSKEGRYTWGDLDAFEETKPVSPKLIEQIKAETRKTKSKIKPKPEKEVAPKPAKAPRKAKEKVSASGRAKIGGEIGVNGYFYKGGQFLPSTQNPPGTFRIKIKGKSKIVKASKEQIEPKKWEVQPTAYSRSIFSLIVEFIDWDHYRKTNELKPLTKIIEYYGDKIRPGVKGVLSKEEYSVEELINQYKKGARWIDIKPEEKEKVLASKVITPKQKGAVPAEIKYEPIKDTKRHSILLKRIQSRLEIPIRTGKFRKKVSPTMTRGGIYKPNAQVIRLAKSNDIPTAMHEVGHHIQEILGFSNRSIPQEVRDMAYEGAPKSNIIREGFAEFVRFYVTEPETAKAKAPNFYKVFEDALSNQTELQDTFLEIRQAWNDFQASPSISKIGSFVVRGEKRKNRLSFNKVYTGVKDNLYPIRQAVQLAEDKGHTFKTSEDPYILARLTRGWARKAEQYLKHGTFQLDPEKGVVFTGKPLKKILAPVEKAGEMEQLDIYLIAKRAVEDPQNRVIKGFERILPGSDFKQAVKELEPKFKKVGEQLQEYNDELLKYLLDSGRIGKDLYNSIKANNPFYAPLYRVVQDEPVLKGLGQKPGNVFNPIKRFKGSSRDIYSPTESLLYNTYVMLNSAERNRIGQAMIKLSQLKGMGGLIEKVPFPLSPVKAQKSDIIKILNKYDVEAEDFSNLPDEIITTFRPIYRTGPNEVIFYDEGKPQLYEIGDTELFKALSNISPSEINLAIKIVSYPAKWLRAGATTFSPEFGIRNPLRDQLTAFIQSEYGYTPGVDFLRGIYHMMGQTKTWQKFNASGAAHSAIVSIDRDYLSKNLKELFKGKIKGKVTNPLEFLQVVSEYTEEATRVGEFAKAFKKEGGDLDALLKSGLAGREVSLDFSRQGNAAARSMNMISAFWNARIEGLDKMARTFKKHPIKASLKAFAAVTLPSILLWYAQKDDVYYNELPAWRRVLFWNYVFHKPDGTLNFVLSIPKPFEYGLLFGTVPELSLDWAYTKDPHAFKEAMKQIGKTFDVFPMPTGAVPLIEWFANKSMFFNRPIVPRGKEDLEPVLQSRPGQSETVKLIAEMMDKVPGLKEVASPAKLENMILGYTAGFGRLGLEAGDWAIKTFGIADVPPDPEMKYSELPGVRALFHRFPSANTKSIEQFYDIYTKLKKSHESQKERKGLRGTLLSEAMKRKGVSVPRPIQLMLYERVAKSLSIQRKQAQSIYESKIITPEKKREYLDNIYLQMINTARAGLKRGKLPSGEIKTFMEEK